MPSKGTPLGVQRFPRISCVIMAVCAQDARKTGGLGWRDVALHGRGIILDGSTFSAYRFS